MIEFPIFRRVDVDDYALFPGTKTEPGLHITFLPGVTMIVGANGLGKTTLINLLYRMLTGPFDIPMLSNGQELGSRRIVAMRLSSSRRNFFRARVSDKAAAATARLTVAFGSQELVIERELRALALSRFQVDGQERATDEGHFQHVLKDMVGVSSFGDFILMLRYLVFYFEDRRALVWDPSAQRQILRMLFLPPQTAAEWLKKERQVLEQDSRMRNLRATMTQEEHSLSKRLTFAKTAQDLRQQLEALENLQRTEREKLEQLESQTTELDRIRHKTRLDHLQADQNHDSRFRALERAKLAALDARFPGQAESGKYILAHLMSKSVCLVCGSHADGAAVEYAKRLNSHRCVVCETPLMTADKVVPPTEVADRRVALATRALEAADRTVLGAATELRGAEEEYKVHIAECARLRNRVADRSYEIDEIVRSLPPKERAIREQRDELAALRTRVEQMKLELDGLREEFGRFVEEQSEYVVAVSTVVESAFAEYARRFLVEDVSISRATHPARVGQGGSPIEFPSYALDMTGTDFDGKVRRSGPDDVSESQREFIDLAFRMALMEAAAQSGCSSLTVDAPESSLDSVFAKRAAEVLARFGEAEPENRLIFTSNLTEGSLLPRLFEVASTRGRSEQRLVDLFKVARSTRALEGSRAEYDEVRRRIFGENGNG